MPLTAQQELGAVLSNAHYCAALLQFGKSEFCAENLWFLLAVRDFNPQLGANPYPFLAGAIPAKAQYIYGQFVSPNAPRQNNLGTPNRLPLTTAAAANNWGQHSFDAAYEEIFLMFSRDAFGRFKRTDAGRTIVAEIAKNQAMNQAMNQGMITQDEMDAITKPAKPPRANVPPAFTRDRR
jgi:hypothetical protein